MPNGRCVRVDVGDDEACITPTQDRFLAPEDKIGCGSFACAYERAGDVLKLTTDPSDVASIIRMQTDPNVVRVFGAWKLRGVQTRLKKVDVYALLVERLQRPSEFVRRVWWEMFLLRESLMRLYLVILQNEAGTPEYRIPIAVRRFWTMAICRQFRGAKARSCFSIVNQALDLHERAARRGVMLVDFHSGNVGIDREGNLRMLDLGVSRTTPQPLPELDG